MTDSEPITQRTPATPIDRRRSGAAAGSGGGVRFEAARPSVVKKHRSRRPRVDAATWKLLRIAAALVAAYFVIAALILLVESSASDGLIRSYPQALWYTLVTVSTVGYGDLYPVSLLGRLLASLLILGSVGFVGYIIGRFSELAVERHHRRLLGMDGTTFTGHYIIIGWTDLARTVVKEILAAGFNVAALTSDEKDITEMRSVFTDPTRFFVTYGIAQDDEAYDRVNIGEAIGAVLLTGDDTTTLITVLELKQLNPDLKITAYIRNPALKHTVENAGVSYVISPNEIVGRMIASAMFEPDVSAFLEDLLGVTTGDDDFDVQEFRLSDTKMIGLDFVDARRRFDELGAQLLAVSRHDGRSWKLIKDPGAISPLRPDDYVIVMANRAGSRAIAQELGVSQGRLV